VVPMHGHPSDPAGQFPEPPVPLLPPLPVEPVPLG
jgi:hypothetical protein